MQPTRSDPVVTTTKEASAATTPASFLRLNEVNRLTGLARSTVYRLMAANRSPAPCRLGTRPVGWRNTDVAQSSATRPSARISRRPM
jgi:prophage regulatory protein